MNFSPNIFNKIDELSVKKIKNILLMSVFIIFLLAGLYLYQTKHSQKSLCQKQIDVFDNLVKTKNLIQRKQLLDQEKESVLKEFESHGNKNLATIVENSAKEAEVTLDPSFKTTLKTLPIEHEPDFTEQQITINSDKLSLREIISLINSLRNEKFVMFRALEIKTNGTVPSCNILLSLRQKK